MFCKNCGKEIDNLASVCIHCGVSVGNGNNYCQNCGKKISQGASFCTECGCNINGVNFNQNQQNFNGNPNNNGNPNINGAPSTNPSAKSKIAAGLLGIFIGGLGIHNFYLGYTGRALTQLLVSILTCGIGAPIMQIWGLIEGIFYLIGKQGYDCDAKGVPLSD